MYSSNRNIIKFQVPYLRTNKFKIKLSSEVYENNALKTFISVHNGYKLQNMKQKPITWI